MNDSQTVPVSMKTLASDLGVTLRTVQRWCQRGLPVVALDDRRLGAQAATVRAWLDARLAARRASRVAA